MSMNALNARRVVKQSHENARPYFDKTFGVHLIMLEGKIIGASANTENAAWHDAAMILRKDVHGTPRS